MTTCGRKIRYGHADTANKALAAMIRKHGDTGLEPYFCGSCRGFHLGHPHWRRITITVTLPEFITEWRKKKNAR